MYDYEGASVRHLDGTYESVALVGYGKQAELEELNSTFLGGLGLYRLSSIG